MEGKNKKNYSNQMKIKNAVNFRHLINDPHATQNDITWIINLRSNNRVSSKINKDSNPPEVYYKKTQAFQLKIQRNTQCQQKQLSCFNSSQFSHMIPKFYQKTQKQSETALKFYSSLRKYSFVNNTENKDKFSTIPYRDKHQTPKILKKEHIKKIKNLTKDNYESVEDGRHNYPEYTHKILATKNYGLLKSFTSIRGRSQISLPCLAWQVGLRNY